MPGCLRVAHGLLTLLFVSAVFGCGDDADRSRSNSDRKKRKGRGEAEEAQEHTQGAEGATLQAEVNPFSRLSDAPPEVLDQVWESARFIEQIDDLMNGYQPELPAIDNPDILRCVTDEAKVMDADLQKLDESLESEIEAAREERTEAIADFYRVVFPVQFRVDPGWESRPGLSEKPVYACWEKDDYYWTDHSRSECSREPWLSWRIRSHTWVEDASINRYSRQETPAQPELMQRMAWKGVEVPERIHCLVENATREMKHRYGCWEKDDRYWTDHSRSECLDDRYYLSWRVRSSTPGESVQIHCRSTSALDSDPVAFSIQMETPEATGALIGDVISVAVPTDNAAEYGSIYADFGASGDIDPDQYIWVVEARADTLVTQASGTCPTIDVAYALCSKADSKSDKHRVIEACIEGENLAKLSKHVEAWERQRFSDKDAILAKARTAIETHRSANEEEIEHGDW